MSFAEFLVLLPGPVFKLCIDLVVLSNTTNPLHDVGEARCIGIPNGGNLQVQKQLSASDDMETNLGMVNTWSSVRLESQYFLLIWYIYVWKSYPPSLSISCIIY